ncbi:MAG TPA: argininosuccinate synthase [Pirellulaceae bacterium]|nr:argininosuccinate synthase [Pirellulaceae bacterium]HMO90737.1 argininosuccinate synthase [Pirellulaceae bacterium]HMP67988.1 argininosuccinate synthase [Pirellulaceae bacterium]
MPSCVLAYSGGLDTSVILSWLLEKGYEVHALYVDLGQPAEDVQAILDKATNCGAHSARSVDVKEELCRDFAFPVLKWQAKYESIYLMGTSIARPLIAKVAVEVAREVGADSFAHGATGKGNDQCRFELAATALEPSIKIVAPWRMREFRQTFPGRSEMLAFCKERKIPVTASVAKPYSRDENCLHVSYEAGELENMQTHGAALIEFAMTVRPCHAPDRSEQVTIEFEQGVPVKLNGQRRSAYEMVAELNKLGGQNGVGIIDVVENRFVGMKSRGVYEAPGMTVLYAAHQCLEQLTLDRDLYHLRNRLSPELAEMVYYGLWYTPKMEALSKFIDEAQKTVTGTVTLELYKGNIEVVSRESDFSLYDAEIATMEGGETYNQDDAGGFLKIMSLPYRVAGQRKKLLEKGK